VRGKRQELAENGGKGKIQRSTFRSGYYVIQRDAKGGGPNEGKQGKVEYHGEDLLKSNTETPSWEERDFSISWGFTGEK